MKKITLIIVILIISTIKIAAQNVRIGTVAGVNLNAPDNLKSKIGYKLGAKAELGLSDLSQGLYLDMALLLETRAWKETYASAIAAYKQSKVSTMPWYLNIPVHIGYRFPVSQNVNIFVNGGPYVAFGLFGKMTHETVLMDGSTEKGTRYNNVFTDKDVNGENVQRRLDWGVGLRLGAEFNNKYQVTLEYDRGFRGFTTDYLSSRANLYSLSFAYMF
ncbi:outer membrane beta-barrel protein [Hoylesella shahii]|uniref:outer membrane beta-barrel protein n=1 Tax=Hoylesella shahii TaxID=228603 RepID=UPI0028E89689|nr:outer membrane beta-barrel protein [Hoylesella shahii]